MDSDTATKQLKELKRLGGVKKMRLAAEEWKEEWETLIAIALSARTRDEVTVIVAEKLFAQYPTAHALGQAKPHDVAKIIMPVNFFQNKSKYVIACAKELAKTYGGKPPHDLEKLMELSGVGRKSSNVFLSQYGAAAIGVDTHVAYISRKLGWTKHINPDKIEADLRNLFPKSEWRELNRTLVRFGKTYMSRTKKDALLFEIQKK